MTWNSFSCKPLLALVPLALLALGSAPAAAKGKEVIVYVNGTDATGIKDVQFRAVDVRIDTDGNIWVDAPRYRINVTRPAGAEAPPPAAAPEQAAPVAVATGQHWLVTQDSGSAGQVIEVRINGTLVREVRSGQAQLILDIGQYLQPGSNVVTFRPTGTEVPSGGALKIHLGEGSNEGGTLKMQNPQLSFSREGSEPSGEKSVEYVVK